MAFENRILLESDCVPVAPGFEQFVQVRNGEGRVGPKEPGHIQIAVAFDHWLQHRSPPPRCGLLTGRDRIHSHADGAACAVVADCSRGGIEYTDGLGVVHVLHVADCSRGGIEYTGGVVVMATLELRIAHGTGSNTLQRRADA